MRSFLVEALELLVTFLADEDPVLISNAQLALRQLLNTKPGQLALADMEAAQRAEAAVFTPSKPITPTPAHHPGYASSKHSNSPMRTRGLPQDLVQERGMCRRVPWKPCWDPALIRAVPELAEQCRRSIEEEEPWLQRDKSYEQWLCRLGDALLDHCRDPLLTALQKVARKRPAMMELVMPQLFASLALEGSADGSDLAVVLAAQVCTLSIWNLPCKSWAVKEATMRSLAGARSACSPCLIGGVTPWQVQQHVLGIQSADLRPVRLVLGALNALRSIHIDAVCGAARKQSRESSAADWQQVGIPASSWYSAPRSSGVRS